MRIQRRSMKKARIEIIPMIDTIFFLLVFFMISTLSMSQYKGMPVNLPKRPPAGRLPPKAPRLPSTKTIDFFSINNRSTSRCSAIFLRQQLVKNPELLVVINADDGVAHGRVVEVMDIARSADVVKMAIAVKPKEQRP